MGSIVIKIIYMELFFICTQLLFKKKKKEKESHSNLLLGKFFLKAKVQLGFKKMFTVEYMTPCNDCK